MQAAPCAEPLKLACRVRSVLNRDICPRFPWASCCPPGHRSATTCPPGLCWSIRPAHVVVKHGAALMMKVAARPVRFLAKELLCSLRFRALAVFVNLLCDLAEGLPEPGRQRPLEALGGAGPVKPARRPPKYAVSIHRRRYLL